MTDYAVSSDSTRSERIQLIRSCIDAGALVFSSLVLLSEIASYAAEPSPVSRQQSRVGSSDYRGTGSNAG